MLAILQPLGQLFFSELAQTLCLLLTLTIGESWPSSILAPNVLRHTCIAVFKAEHLPGDKRAESLSFSSFVFVTYVRVVQNSRVLLLISQDKL